MLLSMKKKTEMVVEPGSGIQIEPQEEVWLLGLIRFFVTLALRLCKSQFWLGNLPLPILCRHTPALIPVIRSC